MTEAAAALSGADAGSTSGSAGAGDAGSVGSGAPANGEWFSPITDENVRNWVQAKGFKDPFAAAESAYNLEKLIGFDKAGRTLVVPKDDATPEERAAFFQKLGTPANADGYKVPEALAADPVVKEFREVALKSGMLPKQFDESVAFVTAKAAAMQAEAQQQASVKGEQDMVALKGEWGQAYDKNIELAKRAATQFIPAKDGAERASILTKIESALGTGDMMRFFSRIGEGLGEHRVLDNGETGGFGVLTPAQANAKIQALKSDKAWTSAYLGGDKGKAAEMQRLIAAANPETA